MIIFRIQFISIRVTESVLHTPNQPSICPKMGPVKPYLDGFPQIVGFFIIHHLF